MTRSFLTGTVALLQTLLPRIVFGLSEFKISLQELHDQTWPAEHPESWAIAGKVRMQDRLNNT